MAFAKDNHSSTTNSTCRFCGDKIYYDIARSWVHSGGQVNRYNHDPMDGTTHCAAPDEDDRCAVCGWPLEAKQGGVGCRRGDCSMRPRPQLLYAPARANQEDEQVRRGCAVYVCGFMFMPKLGEPDSIILVLKQRPGWQAGRLNGVGGGVELMEMPVEAMVREFREETSFNTKREDWVEFCQLEDARGHRVHFYAASTNYQLPLPQLTDGGEPLVHMPIKQLTVHNAIPNLLWLLPMARTMPYERAARFTIKEHSKPAAEEVAAL